MKGRSVYQVRRLCFDGDQIIPKYFVLGGDLFDAPGMIRSELMNCDLPWIAVIRFDDDCMSKSYYELEDSGAMSTALWRDLEATPEELWKEMDGFYED